VGCRTFNFLVVLSGASRSIISIFFGRLNGDILSGLKQTFCSIFFSARLSISFRAPGAEYYRYFIGASLLHVLTIWQDQNPGNSPHTKNTVSLVHLDSYTWLLAVSSAPTFTATVDFGLPLRCMMQGYGAETSNENATRKTEVDGKYY
jgi:hypothetical protein